MYSTGTCVSRTEDTEDITNKSSQNEVSHVANHDDLPTETKASTFREGNGRSKNSGEESVLRSCLEKCACLYLYG